MLEFIDESELELLGLDVVSLWARVVEVELDESVPLLEVSLEVLGAVPVPVLGDVLMLGELVLGAVEVDGLVELGGLVVSLGVVAEDDGVRVVVVVDVVELSVVDCAYT